MMHSQFAPDPSREAPVNPALKCREEWLADGGDACTSCEHDDDEEDFPRGPITFHVTLPRTNSDASLQFSCRDKSSGVMLPSEFLSMTLYATGGSGLRRFLSTERHLANLNKVAAGLMVLVAALMLFKI